MAYSAISKSSLYFNTKLYTGNGSTNAITGVGFQPDFVWIKDRTGTNNHELNDAVRGANHQVFANLNNAETTPTNHLNAFNSDGFTLGNDGSVNTNSSNYCSWNWKAGTTGSGTTSGAGTGKAYSYSVNTTAGFSIIKWIGNGSAGHAIPHHLGVVPDFIILKIRDAVGDPLVYHSKNTSAPETEFLRLKSTNATQDEAAIWNDTAPTSTYFYTGTETTTNGNNNNFIAYCFTEKTGYSKFGSYTGNGNADGTFVYTGFKPAFVMTKRTDSTSDWLICDNKRPGYNVINKKLFPNLNQAEDSYDSFDFVSNGFKIRSSGTGHNASGGTYVYMAFAEEPLVANVGASIPATAR